MFYFAGLPLFISVLLSHAVRIKGIRIKPKRVRHVYRVFSYVIGNRLYLNDFTDIS